MRSKRGKGKSSRGAAAVAKDPATTSDTVSGTPTSMVGPLDRINGLNGSGRLKPLTKDQVAQIATARPLGWDCLSNFSSEDPDQGMEPVDLDSELGSMDSSVQDAAVEVQVLQAVMGKDSTALDLRTNLEALNMDVFSYQEAQAAVEVLGKDLQAEKVASVQAPTRKDASGASKPQQVSLNQ
jgi:hypothetical protein